MIRITHLHKTYTGRGKDHAALTDINIDIAKGEVFGIIGRSGAGKTTLLRTLNLLERPTSGSIEIDGQDITRFGKDELLQLRQGIGMIFQHFNLLYAKTVSENIDWPLKITGKYTREERAARVAELLELVGLTGHKDAYPAKLSGGQKQRVGIARALANYPKILLCDEATSALDPETTQSILKLLRDINRKLGLTIVLITHEMQVIRSVCDRVVVLDSGRIVESGNVVDVFLQPQHAVTQALVKQSHAFEEEIDLASRQFDGTLVQLTFIGDVTYEPIVTNIAASSSAEITILQGLVSRIKDTPYGQLLIEIKGSDEEVAKVFRHFDDRKIHYGEIA